MSEERMGHPTLMELLAYLDDELSRHGRARMAAHVEGCAECGERLRALSAAGLQIADISAGARDEGWDTKGPRVELMARLEAMDAEGGLRGKAWRQWSRSLGYAAALMVLALAGWMLLGPRLRAHEQSLALPNPVFTPGAVRQASLDEICAANDDEVVRTVPSAMEQRVFREYGIKHARPGEFEVDYLITPGLGGSDDVANLWPEPHGARWNSYVKDQLEDRLHHMVCRGQLPLDAAQKEIATDWIAAYKKYFHTDEPLRAEKPVDEGARALQRLALLR